MKREYDIYVAMRDEQPAKYNDNPIPEQLVVHDVKRLLWSWDHVCISHVDANGKSSCPGLGA